MTSNLVRSAHTPYTYHFSTFAIHTSRLCAEKDKFEPNLLCKVKYGILSADVRFCPSKGSLTPPRTPSIIFRRGC